MMSQFLDDFFVMYFFFWPKPIQFATYGRWPYPAVRMIMEGQNEAERKSVYAKVKFEDSNLYKTLLANRKLCTCIVLQRSNWQVTIGFRTWRITHRRFTQSSFTQSSVQNEFDYRHFTQNSFTQSIVQNEFDYTKIYNQLKGCL